MTPTCKHESKSTSWLNFILGMQIQLDEKPFESGESQSSYEVNRGQCLKNLVKHNKSQSTSKVKSLLKSIAGMLIPLTCTRYKNSVKIGGGQSSFEVDIEQSLKSF